MNRQRLFSFFLVAIICSITTAGVKKEIPIYKQSGVSIDARTADLLSRMTIEEKILQLNQYILGLNTNVNNIGEAVDDMPVGIGSYIYFSGDAHLRNKAQRRAMEESRLGIPILFGFDVIHGFQTIYPIPLAQGCTWNPELVRQSCSMAAREARMSGTDWTFSPMIDVARDGRWGRVAEGYGEDPYTNAIFGVASVRGYQGDTLASSNQVAACLKHFAGYGMSEGGRDYTATDISRQALWDTYFPPYEAGIKAGAATVMSAFNDISGVPATANFYLLTEILKKRWAHKGFVVSDWNAVEQLVSQGVAANRKEAALKAFSAGVEMDMKDNCYREYLSELLAENKITIEQIDDAVTRILRLKFELGLFENPYTPIYKDEERILRPVDKELASKVVEESIVLLKNEKNLLPLKDKKKIAVIGPMAKDKQNLLGSWSAHGRKDNVESIYEGLEKEFGANAELLYTLGCDFDGDDSSGFKEACAIAAQSDVILLCLGEKAAWSGENASRSTIALPSIQVQLATELQVLGKSIVLILTNGRPLELCKLETLSDAIVELWQPGIAGGTPLAGILSGRINPSGKLCITFPLTSGQIPVYYNARKSSRPDQGKYQDISTKPLYEFTHGLSYTTFTYGDIKVSHTKVNKQGKLVAEVPVTNSGEMDGYETVHWFISDPYCSISRPVMELKYFEKRFIKKGETVLFSFELEPTRDLSFVDDCGNRILEEGDYYIIVKNNRLKIEVE